MNAAFDASTPLRLACFEFGQAVRRRDTSEEIASALFDVVTLAVPERLLAIMETDPGDADAPLPLHPPDPICSAAARVVSLHGNGAVTLDRATYDAAVDALARALEAK